MNYTKSLFEPKRHAWNANELFANLNTNNLNITKDKRNELKEFFWYDLCAEYDSTNLYASLMKRKDKYSLHFLKFLDVWYLDELNHAEGFCTIYQLIYGINKDEIWKQLGSRIPDFSELEEFLQDEFKLCVLFAYDEFASVMTYQKDTFYGDFGASEFLEWIKRVRSDEALHFGNLVKLIRIYHSDRISETKSVLEKIIQLEKQKNSYKATFLFDHECPHFLLSQDELSGECVNTVLRKITNDKTAKI